MFRLQNKFRFGSFRKKWKIVLKKVKNNLLSYFLKHPIFFFSENFDSIKTVAPKVGTIFSFEIVLFEQKVIWNPLKNFLN